MLKEQKNVEDQNPKDADKDMLDLLVTLKGTPYWAAIKRYNQQRDYMVSQSLRYIDPFKETTQLARIQGIVIGLLDLENGINEEIGRRKRAVEKEVNDQTKKPRGRK